MSENITIVFELSAEFNDQALSEYMSKAKEGKPTGKYEKRIWTINGLTIKQYDQKLVVQGTLNDFTRGFLRSLRTVKGLALDRKNALQFASIFPWKQNVMLCPECGGTFLCVQGEIEGLDMVFRRECGHKNGLAPPVMMLSNRILPDINVLVSKCLSRLVELGYFNGFEVVFPEFILDVVDQFKGSGKKNSVSEELDILRTLERGGKIKINNLSTLPIKVDLGNLGDEDKVILGLAQLTNSVLVTSDKNMRDRALIQERPTVYISASDFGRLKMIREVRGP